ncbi:uncharacterized protein LOC114935357 [Nylanderia fulva]|uniref:uncharacterized protein LOC114935357 n=1 Tax=Nylanderia fulva TaxID=613905 RepID=UPI0010FB8A51|nr:uncharacterized protein LOC114935357 [Nylanderia fulva]
MGKTKRIPRPFIKIKRLLRKRKMILLGHEIKKHVRWKWERDKMHSNLESIATINLNALKITTDDPEIYVDCIRGMSTVSIYDRNYRNPMQENISEVSVHIRPDVTHKLNNLGIGDENESNCDANPPQQDIECDILQQTSILRISDINEPDINERMKNIIVSENVNMQ